jgi:glycerol-3-phosphate dehydrogenase
VASRTAHIPLPGGDLDDVDAAVKDAHDRHGARLPRDVVSHLVAVYGSYADAVAEFAASSAELSARVGAAAPVVAAQLAWAARHEMAVTLEDAVVRRTPLGALGYPGDGPALHAANVVGSELGWSDEQKERQMDALRAFYGNGARRTATAPGRR